MMYSNNFVVCVKHKGRILREYGDMVYIPFGSEYSLLLKNLESRDAVVSVTIDGKETIDELIVRANSNVELERFFEGNNQRGHRFKFIEKTDEIRDYRGDKVEDGLIIVKYRFVKIQPVSIPYYRTFLPYDGLYSPMYGDVRCIGSSNASKNTSWACSSCCNEDGITVKGRESNQKFQTDYVGPLEENEHTITLQLKGESGRSGKIENPITVRTKITCEICGRKWKSGTRFCGNCGNALV